MNNVLALLSMALYFAAGLLFGEARWRSPTKAHARMEIARELKDGSLGKTHSLSVYTALGIAVFVVATFITWVLL
jgi:hypothetical protein